MRIKQLWIVVAVAVVLIGILVIFLGQTAAARLPGRIAPDETGFVSSSEAAADLLGRIQLSVTEFDFGAVPNTRPVSRTFQVRNAGGGQLEITGVSTSCGCTTAEVGDRHLTPGEVTHLAVTYDPRHHGGRPGRFTRLVHVRSNDPDTPEASLTIHVTVVVPAAGLREQEEDGMEVAGLYRAFVCPCCGQDIGSCSCGMAKERRGLIDQHADVGASEGHILQVMFQTYGAGAFFDQALAGKVQADMMAELPDDRPVLIVEPTEIDLGLVPITDGAASGTFTVRNAGQTDLTITGLQTTCGCTTAVIETAQGTSPIFGASGAENPTDWSTVLAPGEKASLIATFDTLFHGPDATGKFKRVVSVTSDDPLSSRLDVAFVIEVTR